MGLILAVIVLGVALGSNFKGEAFSDLVDKRLLDIRNGVLLRSIKILRDL